MFFRNNVERRKGDDIRRRLPVLFCLDVSRSMRYCEKPNPPAIKVLKKSIREMIKQLKKNKELQKYADIEIAVVTFSERVYLDTPFIKLDKFHLPWCRIRGSYTCLANSVLHCYKKLDDKQTEYLNSGQGQMSPYFILVTDGDPDEWDKEAETELAVNTVLQHCRTQHTGKELILPFIIGVGDNMDMESLKQYSQGFKAGFFEINGHVNPTEMTFDDAFYCIRVSFNDSLDLNDASAIERALIKTKEQRRKKTTGRISGDL